jgi:hypothetical protein
MIATVGDDDYYFGDRIFLDDDMPWTEFFNEGGRCTFCDQQVDDPRFAVGISIRRSFSRSSVGYRFCHVECLRRAMHPNHPLR